MQTSVQGQPQYGAMNCMNEIGNGASSASPMSESDGMGWNAHIGIYVVWWLSLIMLDFGKVPPWGHCSVQGRVITPGKLAGRASEKCANLTDYRNRPTGLCRFGMPALDAQGWSYKKGPFPFCNANANRAGLSPAGAEGRNDRMTRPKNFRLLLVHNVWK